MEDSPKKEQVAIAKLDPSLPNLESSYIKAVVTLIWPYSSSNGTLAVLLAEPDFRLRRSRGQVKVQFVGSSARHVSSAGIGSGDELVLNLAGAEWVKDAAVPSQTPGRGIEWELKFGEKLVVQVGYARVAQRTIANQIPRFDNARVRISLFSM
jgi:hypothetical protein